ncbi:alpha/beta hydrolase fold domain-containing protein [Halomicroarcula sp. GCM10025709]|uniref:alpha/beta hydrolase n=1 Tax=Haloarcula TaxID=2237 RepID=UPI0024C29AAA|nr:alpha/beta hydrolase [Halomicroarcula sp. YJ-61-S]
MRQSEPAETLTVTREVPFHETDRGTLRLDVVEPTDVTGPLPVVVLVRGGAFHVGDKGEFARQAMDFASEGYVAIEPQYRLAPDSQFPAPVVDVKAAIEWVRSEGDRFGADPSRISVVGHSAGANLAAMAGVTQNDPAFEPEVYPGTSSAVDAVVGYAGVYDFLAIERQRDEEPDDQVDSGYLGAAPTDDPERAELASPTSHVDTDAAPTLLVHGTADEVVPAAQSELFHEVLEPVTDAELELREEEHGFPFHGHCYDEVFERTASFLDRHR